MVAGRGLMKSGVNMGHVMCRGCLGVGRARREIERNGHCRVEEGCDRACEQAASRGTESVLEANGEGIPQVFFAEIPMTHQYRATIAVGRDGATKKIEKRRMRFF